MADQGQVRLGPPAASQDQAPDSSQQAGSGDDQSANAAGWQIAALPKLHSAVEWPWKTAEPATPPAATTAGEVALASASPGQTSGEGALSFQAHLSDDFELCWQRCSEPSMRLLEQVTDVLRTRSELERKYGETLLNMTGDVKADPQDGGVPAAVDAVMVNFRNRGEQAIELAENIDQDIVSFLDAVIRQHRDVAQRLKRDVQLLMRYATEKQLTHDKLARRYSARCTEAEAVSEEALQGLAMKTADRLKIAQRATMLSKQARSAEHEYYASIDGTNKAQCLLEQHMPAALATVQELADKRGMCIKDALMKLAVYETSWLRNLQYDIEAVVKTTEAADASQDIQNFIKKHFEGKEPKKKGQQLTPQAFWTCGRQKEPARTPPVTRPQVEMNLIIRRLMEEELVSPLHALLGENALPSAPADVKDRVDQIRQNISDPRRRSGLCRVLQAEIMAREPHAVDIDSAKGFVVSPATMDVLVPLVKAALDACDEQGDSWCGRDFMVIVNLIRVESEGGKQVSLLSRVYNHSMWNKVTFWEEVLLIGFCEAHSTEAVGRRSLPPGSQYTQLAMTTFLQRFVGYMMAFGISFDQGRNSVWATIRKNASLLGSTCKPYANLLLQSYEAPVVGRTSTSSAPAPREMQAAADAPDAAGLAAAPGSSAPIQEDDFEAVALGLPADAPDSEEDAELEPDPDQGDLKEIAAQRSTDEVFS